MSQRAPVLQSPNDVGELAQTIRDAGRFALDFEFMWEKTYRPVPCLAQVAVGDDVWIVDPMDGGPLEPLAELVSDPAVTTITHAPSADLLLLAMHFDAVPRALADVQLIAGFVGVGAGQSLATLLQRVLGVRLAKTESFSDWARRPLTRAQLGYARDDVLHLFALHDRLMEQAEDRGRRGWVLEEHERRYGPHVQVTTDPMDAWRKVKGQGRLDPRQRAVLVQLAAWREREAARRDRPTGWLVQDRILIDIARRQPSDADAVAATRGADRFRQDDVEAIVAAVRKGQTDSEVRLPPAPPPEVTDRVGSLAALGQLLVSTRAAEHQIASPLVATRAEIESFFIDVVQGQSPTGELASGWRHELVGDALTALAEGRLALRPSDTPPYIDEVPITSS